MDILIIRTNFQKSDLDWPQQPPTGKVLKSVKNWIFDGPFHKNGPVCSVGHFDARDDPIIGSSDFF